MTTTIREQVFAAIKTALDKVVGVTVFRNRDDELAASEMPALVLLDGGHDVVDLSSGETNYTARFSVELYATAATDAALGAALTALWGAAVVALRADVTLGGLAVDCREVGLSDPQVLREGQGAPFAAAVLEGEVDFATAEGDPFNVA